MRPPFVFLVIAALLAAFLPPSRVHAQSNVVTLTLERSTNGLSGWETVQVTTNTVPAGMNAFYRMRIAALPPATNNMITVQGGTLPQSSQLAGTMVATFQIGKYEVRYDEWLEVRNWAATNGYDLHELVWQGGPEPGGPGGGPMLAPIGFGGPPNGTKADHPVSDVNWYEAVKWCNAKSEKEGLTPVYRTGGSIYRNGQSEAQADKSANGYRLPTEAEWEWAARGGVKSQGYTYSGGNDVNAVAWYYGNNGSLGPVFDNWSKVVGTKAPNELGIHDMSGNLWEWCEDGGFFNESVRFIRGGSKGAEEAQCAVGFRSVGGLAFRGGNPPNTGPGFKYGYGFVGLRIARNAP